jgi:hypothetical protein
VSISQHDNPHDTILPVTGLALIHVARRVIVDGRHHRGQRSAGLGCCSSPPVFGFRLGRCRGKPRAGVSAAAASPDRLDRPVGSQQQRNQQDAYDSEQHRHGYLPSGRHRTIPNAK